MLYMYIIHWLILDSGRTDEVYHVHDVQSSGLIPDEEADLDLVSEFIWLPHALPGLFGHIFWFLILDSTICL